MQDFRPNAEGRKWRSKEGEDRMDCHWLLIQLNRFVELGNIPHELQLTIQPPFTLET